MNIIAVDWGKDARKRSAYRAEVSARLISRLKFDGSLSHLVGLAATLEPPVLIGIDAAIGFPSAAWNQLVGNQPDPAATFIDYLLDCQLPDHFFDPIQTPEEWAPSQPFIRPPPGSWSLKAFIGASKGGFYRQIDQCLNGSPIFVTSGIPGSVGSGTRALWQELLALKPKSGFGIWPFHGSLGRLILAGKPIIAEIYPKACYGIALAESLPSPLVSIARTRRHAREVGIERLIKAGWVINNNVRIQDRQQATANEDDFDALLSAAALLRLFLEEAPIESLVSENLNIEGGVLGSASILAGKQKISRPPPHRPKKANAKQPGDSRQYPCPIPGCGHVFQNSRGGWDAHVASLKRHPHWHPDTPNPTERKTLFKQLFTGWFSD